MSATPTTPEGCRAMAVECGRKANRLMAKGMRIRAHYQIQRARELTLLALRLEASEAHKPALRASRQEQTS